jgi:5-methyltetrahydropteroyltriglutamate--homocysteine methyltransferase
MRFEYEAMVAAGFDLLVDCPDLAMGRHIQYASFDLPEFRKRATKHVEAPNRALRNTPAERVRRQYIGATTKGPHHYDVPLANIVDIKFAGRPASISFETANPRHAHE